MKKAANFPTMQVTKSEQQLNHGPNKNTHKAQLELEQQLNFSHYFQGTKVQIVAVDSIGRTHPSLRTTSTGEPHTTT